MKTFPLLLILLPTLFAASLVLDSKEEETAENDDLVGEVERELRRRWRRPRRPRRWPGCLRDFISSGTVRQHLRPVFVDTDCPQDASAPPCAYGRRGRLLNGTLVCRTIVGCQENKTYSTCIAPNLQLNGTLAFDDCGICPDDTLPPTCECACSDVDNGYSGILLNKTKSTDTTLFCVPQDVAVSAQLRFPDKASCVELGTDCDSVNASDIDFGWFERDANTQ